MPFILPFIVDLFKLIFTWTEIFPSLLNNYADNIDNPDLFIVDINTALSLCGFELFDMI